MTVEPALTCSPAFGLVPMTLLASTLSEVLVMTVTLSPSFCRSAVASSTVFPLRLLGIVTLAAPLEKLTVIVSPEETLVPAVGLEETALPRSTSAEATSSPLLNCRPASSMDFFAVASSWPETSGTEVFPVESTRSTVVPRATEFPACGLV